MLADSTLADSNRSQVLADSTYNVGDTNAQVSKNAPLGRKKIRLENLFLFSIIGLTTAVCRPCCDMYSCLRLCYPYCCSYDCFPDPYMYRRLGRR